MNIKSLPEVPLSEAIRWRNDKTGLTTILNLHMLLQRPKPPPLPERWHQFCVTLDRSVSWLSLAARLARQQVPVNTLPYPVWIRVTYERGGQPVTQRVSATTGRRHNALLQHLQENPEGMNHTAAASVIHQFDQANPGEKSCKKLSDKQIRKILQTFRENFSHIIECVHGPPTGGNRGTVYRLKEVFGCW